MKTVLHLIFILSIGNAFSQEHFRGLSVGMNQAKPERETYDYYKSVSGLSGELFYQYKKGLLFSKSSLGFQQKGFSQELIFTDTSGTIIGSGSKETTRFSYLSLNELVGVEFGGKVFGYLGLGISFSYYLMTDVRTKDFILNDGQKVEGYHYQFQNVKRPELSAFTEAGFGFHTKHDATLLFITALNMGITQNRYSNATTFYPWRNNFLSFRVGYRFSVEKFIKLVGEERIAE